MAVSIVLAGHGYGRPSTKGMNAYCQSRQAQGRGLVEVRRFPNITESQRRQMHDGFASLIGRNLYSQNLRMYCYVKYKGNYYSDCSSAICLTAARAGFAGVGSYNTAGMHYNLEKVEDIIIKNGLIQNPELLRVGDALMFKGSDPKRPLQIGHTEMVYEISGAGPIITPTPVSPGVSVVRAGQMHCNNFTGAGLAADGIRGPKTKEGGIMALQTGLNLDYKEALAVDGVLGAKTTAALQGKAVKRGSRGYLVTALEILLMLKGYEPNGVESPGVFGEGSERAVIQYQKEKNLAVDGIAGFQTFISLIK